MGAASRDSRVVILAVMISPGRSSGGAGDEKHAETYCLVSFFPF